MSVIPPPPDLRGTQFESFVERIGRMYDAAEALGPPSFKVVATSWYRSPTHNAKVGGAPNSFHLRGLAVDFDVPGRRVEAFPLLVALAQQFGLRALNEGDHIHVDVGRG